MEKVLSRIESEIKVWYYKDGEKVFGLPPGLHGNITGLRGDIDEAKLTYEERKKGVDVKDLIK